MGVPAPINQTGIMSAHSSLTDKQPTSVDIKIVSKSTDRIEKNERV